MLNLISLSPSQWQFSMYFYVFQAMLVIKAHTPTRRHFFETTTFVHTLFTIFLYSIAMQNQPKTKLCESNI
jgi:hypothetical protein